MIKKIKKKKDKNQIFFILCLFRKTKIKRNIFLYIFFKIRENNKTQKLSVKRP